jgi:hypothetical protein
MRSSTDLHAVARHCAKCVSDLGEDSQGGQPEKRRLHPSHERLFGDGFPVSVGIAGQLEKWKMACVAHEELCLCQKSVSFITVVEWGCSHLEEHCTFNARV